MAILRPEDNQYDRHIAKFIAVVIRNAMEDFHVRHLTDNQMKVLNPIVRNAVFTALHSLSHMNESEAAQAYVKYQERMIPEYWEEPRTAGRLRRHARSPRRERIETGQPRPSPSGARP